jgi:hypothetical protein
MCGCNKKRLAAAGGAGSTGAPSRPSPMRVAAATAAASTVEIAPATVWGPPLWSILHCMAYRIGRSGNTRMDTDEARHFESLIESLYTVLPCAECQEHCRQYLISAGRDRKWRGLYGENLRNTVSKWLSDFHNAVRVRQEKEPLTDVDYSTCSIPESTLTIVMDNIKNASSINLVRNNHLRRWTRTFNELKLLLGL